MADTGKLLAFQKEVAKISKDSTNPFYKSKYFDINALINNVKPLLNTLELTLVQPIITMDGHNVLNTILFDGNTKLLESWIQIPDMEDPQKLGSAITYYRRYAIQSMLLLQAEDDDANLAIPQKKTTKVPKPIDTASTTTTKQSTAPLKKPELATHPLEFDPLTTRIDFGRFSKKPKDADKDWQAPYWVDVPTKFLEWCLTNLTEPRVSYAQEALDAKAKLKSADAGERDINTVTLDDLIDAQDEVLLNKEPKTAIEIGKGGYPADWEKH